MERGVEYGYMKTTKFIVLSLAITIGLTNSVFASWWNPTTWKIFRKENKLVVQQKVEEKVAVTATTSSIDESDLLFCNGSKYSKCSTGQTFICPTNGEEGFCQKDDSGNIKIPKVKTQELVSEKKVTPKAQVLNSSVIVKNTTATTKEENYNSQIIELTDYVISSTKNYLGLFEVFNEILDGRIMAYTESKKLFDDMVDNSVPVGANVPNDLIRSTSKLYDTTIASVKYIQKYSLDTTSKMNERISILNSKKQTFSNGFYTKDQAKNEMKDVMNYFAALEEDVKLLNKMSDGYFSTVQKTDKSVAVTVQLLINNSNKNLNREMSSQTTVTESKITIPAIQYPKTSYCNVSYTGIHGNYNITCN